MMITAPPIEKKRTANIPPQNKEAENQVSSSLSVVSSTNSIVTSTATSSNNTSVSETPVNVKSNVNSNPAINQNQTAQSNQNSQPSTVANQPPTQNQNATALYSIASIVDGDTVKVNINGTITTIRLIGINTPEVVDPRTTVQCFGREASNQAKALLNGKKVRLESDPTQDNLDKYGRLLRYVYLEDGTFFNKKMIADGYAYEYTYNTPYKYQSEFKATQVETKKNLKGLWSPTTCNGNLSMPTTGTIITSTSTSSQSAVTGHTFYTSSYYTSRYYYCDSDEVWKSLSSKYLKSFSSEAILLQTYPDKTLHLPCN